MTVLGLVLLVLMIGSFVTSGPSVCPACGGPLPRPSAPFCPICGEILDGSTGRLDDGEEA